MHPLVVGGVVLLRTPVRLLAIDWKSGEQVWAYCGEESVEKPQPGPFGMDPFSKIQQRLEDDVLWASSAATDSEFTC